MPGFVLCGGICGHQRDFCGIAIRAPVGPGTPGGANHPICRGFHPFSEIILLVSQNILASWRAGMKNERQLFPTVTFTASPKGPPSTYGPN
jgi:hypothetical protein